MIPTILTVAVSVSVLCSNLNWEHSPRCQEPPAYFERTATGWEGELTNGIAFTQTIYTPEVHSFRMEDVHFLIIKGEIVYVE